MTTTVENTIGPQVPQNSFVPIYGAWRDWHDAMLYVGALGATVADGKATSLRDATKATGRFFEVGDNPRAAYDDETFGLPVLDTVGSPMDSQGYRVPMSLIDVSQGFTWGVIFRRDVASLTEGGTLFSIRQAINDQNVIFHLRLFSNGNISTVVRHRSRNDSPSTCTNAAVVSDKTWYAYRGRVDWSTMTHKIDRRYPAIGIETSAAITPSIEPGAPDWSRMAAVVLDKAFSTSSGRFTGQFGALVLMKGVLIGDDLTDFDNRLIALAAKIAAA